MKIDFENMEEIVLNNFYGGQKATIASVFKDDNCKIMYGRLEPGASIGIHTHTNSSEIVFILEGECTIIYDNEKEVIKAGQCHYCPKGHTHSVMNLTENDMHFFTVVPKHEDIA